MIRELRVNDIPEIHIIAALSLDEIYSPEVFEYFTMQWRPGQLVAFSADGCPVGFVSSAKIGRDTVRIMMLAVDPAHRSRGIGRELIAALRMRAMLEGITNITLEVRDTNTQAISFYRSNGFIPLKIEERFYNDGGSALRMIGRVQLNI